MEAVNITQDGGPADCARSACAEESFFRRSGSVKSARKRRPRFHFLRTMQADQYRHATAVLYGRFFSKGLQTPEAANSANARSLLAPFAGRF